MIGMIGAMATETALLSAAMAEKKEEIISGITYISGVLDGQAAVVATCGPGKVNAAVCAQTMVLRYAPALLVNTGVAGTLTAELGIGDVAVANAFVQHDVDTTALGDAPGYVSGIGCVRFAAEETLAARIAACVREQGRRAMSGCIATGDQFIDSDARRAWIAGQFGAIACDMEGGAIAQVAALARVPFVALRAISDRADGAAVTDYPRFVAESAAFSARVLRSFLLTLS